MFSSPITFDRFARIVLVSCVVALLFFLLYKLESVLLPFCIAALLAYLLHPLVEFIQERMRVRNRMASICLALVVIAGVLFGMYIIVVPPLFDEVARANNLIAHYLSGSAQTSSIPAAIHTFLNTHIDLTVLQQYLTEDNIVAVGKELFPHIQTVVSQSFTVLGVVATTLLVLLYVFFILLDYEAMTCGWLKLIPLRNRERIATLVYDIKNSMNRYFRGQALIALIVAVLTSIGFLIIGLPMAIAMGLLVGILTLVPYLKVVALIPTCLLTLLKSAETGQNFWWLIMLLLIVFIVVQVIEDAFIVPKIMGHITGLHPAIILLSLSVWGCLLGVIGIIIALPVTSLLLTYYRSYRLTKDNPE